MILAVGSQAKPSASRYHVLLSRATQLTWENFCFWAEIRFAPLIVIQRQISVARIENVSTVDPFATSAKPRENGSSSISLPRMALFLIDVINTM